MKFSAAIASALVLGAAQPAVAELHVGHRAAHQHYGKRHNHAADASASPQKRQPEPVPENNAHLHLHDNRLPRKVESLPALFTRNPETPATEAAVPIVQRKAPRSLPDEALVAAGIPLDISKRAICELPTHPDIVAVPGASNGGWAMAPDVSCTAGSWCPIACVSGKVMAQWKPDTTYVYPESMDGGLYCGSDGTPSKGFKDQPYCVDGTGTISAVNKCGSVVSFCQTVLPGDEGMYIPTDVSSTATLAVPGPSYWDGTAAHYYINPPGTSGSDGCIWGSSDKPIGNWAPYVAGANTDSSGQSYIKLGWNPIWTESSLTSDKPTFGLRVECDDCNGLPCEIGADNMDDLSVTSSESAAGAGGATFCVATIPKGSSAQIVVYSLDGSSSGGGGGGGGGSSSSTTTEAASSSSAAPTTTSIISSSAPPSTTSSSPPSSSSTLTSSSISSSAPPSSSSSLPSSSSSSSSSFSSSSSSSSSSTSSSWSSSSSSSSDFSWSSFTSSTKKSSSTKTSTSSKSSATAYFGGIFHENSTSSDSSQSGSGGATGTATGITGTSTSQSGASASASSKSQAVHHRSQGGAAIAGLIIAVVAGMWLY